MPNSPLEPGTAPEAVRAHLLTVLPQSQVQNASVHQDYAPLVLLRSGHVMAAFAFSNGDMTTSYESLYGGFKRYYAGRRSELDAVDLSFVFCVRPDVPSLDLFCSHVETDVYFCRKFVVPLSTPVGDSLARLPFLPLSRLSDDLSLRPPTAQTFLQRSGVPTTLARYLAMQRQRSPEGIVEDCLAGEFGDIQTPQPAKGGHATAASRTSAPVRFEAVTISDFRAYRKPQSFELGSDLTVLYGPNGFGKTSFFDAVDFVVTGDIGRLKTADDAHFRKTATHLDSDTLNADVSLLFSSNGTIRKLVRQVNDRNHGILDGNKLDRKALLTELTGATVATADRVENLVSLFRATHLFSQEHQELAKNFRDDCELSEQVVTRLLAFEDYARAIDKASVVRDILRKESMESQNDTKRLRQEIIEANLQLKRLGQATSQDVPAEAVGELVDTLRRELEVAGIQGPPEETDLATVRAWRARCEQQVAMGESALARLVALSNEVATLPVLSTELQRVDSQIARLDSDREANDKALALAQSEHRRAQTAVSEGRTVRQNLQARAAAAEWIRVVAPTYRRDAERLRTVRNELIVAQDALATHRESVSAGAAEVRELEERSALQATVVDRAHQNTEAMRHVLGAVRQWDENQRVMERLQRSRAHRVESVAKLASERDHAQKERDALVSERDSVARMLALDDQRQSALRRLIAELEGHVSGSICPLCGHDHSTQEELLAQIREHVAVDRASERRALQQRLDTQLAQLSEAVAAATSSIALLEAEEDREQVQLTELKKANLQFESLSRDENIDLNGDVDTVEGRIQSRLALLSETLNQGEAALVEARGQLASARENVAALERALPALVAAVTEKQSVEVAAQRSLELVKADERAAKFLLDASDEDIAATLQNVASELQEAGEALANAEEDEAKATIELDTRRQTASQLTKAVSEMRARAAKLRRALAETNSKAEEAGIEVSELNERLVSGKIDAESRRQARLRELRDKTASVERSLDAATTAAVLENLRQTIANKERLERDASARVDARKPWIEYFDTTKSILFSQQNDAVARFTREYGPRTSVIQRRLRSVYGFDSIELQSHASTIRVRVTRNGEELRPTDFFSQSQQQTLLLGLFLTACISQTWSSLSPIFLDDPVTHFDDLNTYAFLDLIVGLLESEPEQRQFVISTCDEKFLQLARQKAKHLGDRAQFYSFSAIGAEGPVVERLASG